VPKASPAQLALKAPRVPLVLREPRVFKVIPVRLEQPDRKDLLVRMGLREQLDLRDLKVLPDPVSISKEVSQLRQTYLPQVTRLVMLTSSKIQGISGRGMELSGLIRGRYKVLLEQQARKVRLEPKDLRVV
jgi:hypothetical protein